MFEQVATLLRQHQRMAPPVDLLALARRKGIGFEFVEHCHNRGLVHAKRSRERVLRTPGICRNQGERGKAAGTQSKRRKPGLDTSTEHVPENAHARTDEIVQRSQIKAIRWLGLNFVGERIGLVGREEIVVPPLRARNGVSKGIILCAGDPGAVHFDGPMVRSHIVSRNASANMAGFAMDNISVALEVWTNQPADALGAIMNDLPCASTGFIVVEMEIQAPSSDR